MLNMNKIRSIAALSIFILFLSSFTGCTLKNTSTDENTVSPVFSSSPAPSAAPSSSPTPSVFSVINEKSYQIAPGIKYTKLSLTGKGILDGKGLIEAVDIMETDPANPLVKLETASPLGKVFAREAASKQAMRLDYKEHRVVGAFNMDFFDVKTFYGIPRGIQISDGEVITAPLLTANSLLIKDGGKADIQTNVPLKSTVTAVESGTSINLDAINRPRSKQDLRLANVSSIIVLMTEKFSEKTASEGDGVEAFIKPDAGYEKLQAGKTVAGTVESIVETSNNEIPKGRFVLSANGTKADWLKTNLKAGSKVEIKVNFEKGINEADNVISGDNGGTSLYLLENGELTKQARDTGLVHNKERHPRTMVAVKQGKVYIVSFDGRQPGYADGITLTEGARYLQSLGMEKAYNADGGGSTTCVVKLPGSEIPAVQNRPSDGAERAVGNSLVVISTAAEK